MSPNFLGWGSGIRANNTSANYPAHLTGVRFPMNGGPAITAQLGGIPLTNNHTRAYASNCFSSNHTGGAQVAMADGSVQFFSENMNTTILQNLGAMNDGNPTSLP